MFAWGENSIANFLGFGREVLSPERLPEIFPDNSVKVIAAAEQRCCILLHDGSIHVFGKSRNGSLCSERSSTKVTAFETLSIVDVIAGGDHMFAVTESGQLYGWGDNSYGQLGWKDSSSNSIVEVPRSIKGFRSRKVVQVSCGKFHSLILLHDGAIYSMGDNTYGQLGIGNHLITAHPTEISSLRGLPISQIVARGWHSFCVTISGRVFCWGRNDFGQLGLGDRANRSSPNPLRMLRSHAVTFVCAGDFHSAVLTKDGGVFTFGSSSKGQLGHGTISECEVNPRKVFELMGSAVSQVACGKRHTFAFVPGSGHIFACGSGDKGQLGLGNRFDCLKVPTIIKGPWCDVKFQRSDRRPNPGELHCNVKQVTACGNQSFVTLSSDPCEPPVDFRITQFHRKIWTLSSELCERILSLEDYCTVPTGVIAQLECIMSSQSCLNASFLTAEHHISSTKYSGLSLMEARLLFAKIMQCKNKLLLVKIESYLQHGLIPSLSSNPPDIEALRLYIALPEFRLLHNPASFNTLLFPFISKLLQLAENPSKVLDQWYRSMDTDYFLTPIAMCQKCIVFTVKLGLPPGEVKPKVLMMLDFLSKLNKVNNTGEVSVVNFRKFYIPELNELIPMEADYQQWARNKGTDFSFCRYPFVFNSKAKTILLQIDARIQMHDAYLHARGQNMAAFLGLDSGFIEPPIIEVEIRRDKLVEDAIRSIGGIENLKRPFMVKFVGEEGQDAGGVRKEFFMLVLREVLNPKYGMFRHFKDSNLLWFSDYEIETDEMYLLVGTLCGLAIYNSTIIDLNFPLALYKKLLGVQPTMYDLKELDPALGNGMQQLLDYVEEDGNTVEDAFCMNFTVASERFGDITYVDLVDNGSRIPITNENRNNYVQAYIDYIFNDSIKSPFQCFSKGFHRVCGGEVMNLFRPEELMEMVVGNQNYDWDELEKKTKYKGDYYPKHIVILWFWEVFRSLSLDEKKEFTRFLTGYSKIPIDGFEIIIRPVPFSDDYLPVAHTCFNVLDLPKYSSKQILEEKLRIAITSRGFHLE